MGTLDKLQSVMTPELKIKCLCGYDDVYWNYALEMPSRWKRFWGAQPREMIHLACPRCGSSDIRTPNEVAQMRTAPLPMGAI